MRHALLSFVLVAAGSPGEAWAAKVRVPAGTAVLLKTVTEVTPDNGAGDVVSMTVVQDVKIDGRVVIKAGETAQGEVVGTVKQSYLGVPAKVVMAARRVNAVDGTTITIGNTKTAEGNSKMACSVIGALICLVPAIIKGGNTKIPSGTIMDTVTTAPADVDVP